MNEKEKIEGMRRFLSAAKVFALHLELNALTDAEWERVKALQMSRRSSR